MPFSFNTLQVRFSFEATTFNEATAPCSGHGQPHFLDVDLKPLLLDEDLIPDICQTMEIEPEKYVYSYVNHMCVYNHMNYMIEIYIFIYVYMII